MYKKTIVYFARNTNYYHEGKIKETDKGGTRSMIGDVINTRKVLIKARGEEKFGRSVHGWKGNIKTYLK
jgi:hypothetical protein